MSVASQLVLMSEYNRLMNQRQYTAVAKLPKHEIYRDKGAFFKSIWGTLNHIVVGDIIWLKRFSANASSRESLDYLSRFEQPDSLDVLLFKDYEELSVERARIDELIINWVQQLSEEDLNECISYTNMAGRVFSKPYIGLIHHLFLHQVHHRGQVTTLLSQCGLDFGETDLVEMIQDCSV